MVWLQLLEMSVLLMLTDAGITLAPATISPQEQGTCALEEHRKQVREQIQMKTKEIISGSFLPTLCNLPDSPLTSCDDVPQNCSSGWYWLVNPSNESVKMYCDLDRKCGCDVNGSGGAWMRVAHLDMTNLEEKCPEGLRTIESPKRSCRRSYQTFQTSIVPYSTFGFSYSHVCGRIIAYQYGITEGLGPINNPNNAERAWSIDHRSLDGVILSYGQPGYRKHIWSFVSASSEDNTGLSSCPCINNRSETVQNLTTLSIMGNSYFCDTGVRRAPVDDRFYPDNPLWDGEGCGAYNSCCQFNNPPWFCTQLSQPTNEDIEVRLTATGVNQNIEGEDTPIEKIEIFVR